MRGVGVFFFMGVGSAHRLTATAERWELRLGVPVTLTLELLAGGLSEDAEVELLVASVSQSWAA